MHSLYELNQPVRLRGEFINAAGALANPTAITLTVTSPAGVVTTFLIAALTNPSTGVFYRDFTGTNERGVWTYRFVASGGGVDDTQEEFFVVGSSTQLAGPCDLWLVPSAVFGCHPCSSIVEGSRDYGTAARAAVAASELLFNWSGKRFTGLCDDTIRPCRRSSCWDLPYGSWALGGTVYGWGACLCGAKRWDLCGCPNGSVIPLPGVPVWGVLEVRIDGAVLAASAYRLDDRKLLRRIDDDVWPSCQDLTANPATDDNTFQIRLVRGTPAPEMGSIAAADLACEIYRGLKGEDCRLPQRVTNIVRQGVSMELIRPTELGVDSQGNVKSGIRNVDLFLSAFGRNGPRKRRGSVASPDVGPAVTRTL